MVARGHLVAATTSSGPRGGEDPACRERGVARGACRALAWLGYGVAMRRVFALILVALALAVAANAATPSGALADKKCASFIASGGFKIPVYVRGTSCRRGTQVLRRFVNHGGGTHKRVLGWRCNSGTGGSFCHRGHDRIQTGRI